MTYTSKNRWIDYIVLGFSVFLVFCLIFEQYIELPSLVSWVGRWHPLVLHFPIVLLLIAIFLGLSGQKVPDLLLTAGVISALVTAVSGFFLGNGSPAKGDLLFWHQWFGAGVALLAALWYGLSQMQLDQKIYTKGVQVALVVLVVVTGHYGGMVTHGEEFLALPTERRQEKIPIDPIIYKDIVTRILDGKCVSCHNPNKQKGELVMTDLAALLKGGESGNTLVPGEPEQSELIKRLHLPKEDEGYMPPEGKTPLNEVEIAILERWIALGASDTLRFGQLEKAEPLVGYIKGLMEPDPMEKWTKLPEVADTTLQNLSSDYLTIKRIASNSDALSISAYLSPNYDSKNLTDLARVADNIVELDLSGLPIGQEEMAFVGSCSSLEWLELDKTGITDTDVGKLIELRNLRLLKVYGTAISDQSVSIFQDFPNLKSLYIWETDISEKALDALREAKPGLLIDNGMGREINAFFAATDSIKTR
ncbi:putative membrane protein [Arenibacter algicola]|uniref:Membrane protein n=1 Tax=Arenibacter algicola TaxID=616991 RepID=A0ABY3AH12_9FLAO